MSEERDYYYSHEVARILGVPESEMWRMKSFAKLFYGKQGFPKKVIDSMRDSWFSILCYENPEKFYRLEVLATAIKRNPEGLRKYCIEVFGCFWISEENKERIVNEIASRQPWRRETISKRLPKPNTRQEAEKYSAGCQIHSLKNRLSEEQERRKQLAEKHQELAEDRAELEQWLDDAQERFDREKSISEKLRAEIEGLEEANKLLKEHIVSPSSQNVASILAELEEAKLSNQLCEAQSSDLHRRIMSLESDNFLLKERLADNQSKAQLLEEIRNLLERN